MEKNNDMTNREVTPRRLKATRHLEKLRTERRYNDREIARKIGISRTTLYKRLRVHDWKRGEMIIIESML